jgi:L-aspartate oxidase
MTVPRPATGTEPPTDPAKLRVALQQAMTSGAGVLRSAASLATAAETLERISGRIPPSASGGEWTPLANLARVAGGLITAASIREESRGNHTRTDFPETDPAFWCRLVAS